MAKYLTQIYDGHNNVIGEHLTDEDPNISQYGIVSVRTGKNTATHYKDWGKLNCTLVEDTEDND